MSVLSGRGTPLLWLFRRFSSVFSLKLLLFFLTQLQDLKTEDAIVILANIYTIDSIYSFCLFGLFRLSTMILSVLIKNVFPQKRGSIVHLQRSYLFDIKPKYYRLSSVTIHRFDELV